MIIELLLRHSVMRKLKTSYYSFFVKLKAKSIAGKVTANGRVLVNKHTSLGNNVNFNGFEVKGNGTVTIGNNFHSGTNCKVITDTHDFDNGDAIPYGRGYIIKNVTIGNNVWLGDDVTILGGVVIQEGAIVQAGSVVVKDVGYCEIVGGHPAKTFKTRDVEHYEHLRSKGAFH